MKKKLPTIVFNFILMLLLVFIDQFSKYYFSTNLVNGKEIVIWEDVLKLVSAHNTGAVWSILSDSTTFLTYLTIIEIILVFVLYFFIPFGNKRLKPLRYITVFVLAGAFGNLIDRIRLKYVYDFIYFELIDFPVFNIADCYITVSMILLLVLVIFYYKDEDFSFIKFLSSKKNSAKEADTEADKETDEERA